MKILDILVLSFVFFHVVCLLNAASVSPDSLKAYYDDLNKELSSLTNTKTRLTNVISLLSSNNATSNIVAIRSNQVKKLQVAIDNMKLEMGVISFKCMHYLGDNCDVPCTVNCTAYMCFGVSSTSSEVCSGHGNCTGYNICNCADPYLGTQCQQRKNVTIVADASGFKYADGTYARSCQEYRHPRQGYNYLNEGSGLYQIKPISTLMTVYCDMETDGGGWTLIAGLRNNYFGDHFHVFDDNTAVTSSSSSSFHIKTAELFNVSTQIRAATDKSSLAITNFYTPNWPLSASCDIPELLRGDIQYTRDVGTYAKLSSFVTPERQAQNCKVLNGAFVVPTHMVYCKSAPGHSVGFRFGVPEILGQAQFGGWGGKSVFVTYSYNTAPEGAFLQETFYGIHVAADNSVQRNGVLFLR